MPQEVLLDAVAPTPGFTARTIQDQANRTVAIQWSGGTIPPESLELFRFSATMPEDEGSVQMTATQAFEDDSTKVWRTPIVDVAAEGGGTDTSTWLAVAALVIAVLTAIAVVVQPARALRSSGRPRPTAD